MEKCWNKIVRYLERCITLVLGTSMCTDTMGMLAPSLHRQSTDFPI